RCRIDAASDDIRRDTVRDQVQIARSDVEVAALVAAVGELQHRTGAQFPADGRVPGGRPRRASAGGDRETRILDAVVVDQAILWDGSKDLLWCQRTNARRIAGEAQIKVRIALAYALRKRTGRAVKVDCRRGTGCEVRIRCAPHPGQRRMRNSEAA